MFKRRAKEDDYLGPSRGFAKLFHRFMMTLLWPLRHPVWFILIVFILFLAPTFRGVKPAEVHLWYWNHIKASSSVVGTMVSDKTKDIIPELPNVSMPSITVKSTAEKAVPVPKVAELPIQESRRKIFEKAKTAPVVVDIKQDVTIHGKKLHQAINNEQAKPAAKKKLALVYLKEPKFIQGPATVVNANELRINNESVILYGIYIDPNTQKGQEAKIFLSSTLGSKVINCRVEAYTYQGVATAICLLNETNINKMLVENGYSKNVALD